MSRQAVRAAVLEAHCRELKLPRVWREHAGIARQARNDGWDFGDAVCDDDENPISCRQDCVVNIETGITCLFEDPKSCVYSDQWFLTVLFLIIIGGVIVAIFIFEGKKDPRWLKKWF